MKNDSLEDKLKIVPLSEAIPFFIKAIDNQQKLILNTVDKMLKSYSAVENSNIANIVSDVKELSDNYVYFEQLYIIFVGMKNNPENYVARGGIDENGIQIYKVRHKSFEKKRISKDKSNLYI